MIESPNYDDILPFEKKCLYGGLLIPSKIIINEKNTFRNIDLFLSKLHVICPENLYNNIIKNYPKPYQSSTRITKLNSENMLYMVENLKLPCYITM